MVTSKGRTVLLATLAVALVGCAALTRDDAAAVGGFALEVVRATQVAPDAALVPSAAAATKPSDKCKLAQLDDSLTLPSGLFLGERDVAAVNAFIACLMGEDVAPGTAAVSGAASAVLLPASGSLQ